MKLSKKMRNIIRLRKECAKRLLQYESKVLKFCEKYNIDINELMNNYGCMLITEPEYYAQKTIEIIEKA